MVIRLVRLRAFLLFASLFALTDTAKGAGQFTTVDYLGNRISLSRAYPDFDAYRDDPKNLPQQSIRKVESIMRGTPFARSFANDAALSRELERIQFPGYGTFYANQLGAKLDPSLELVYVEIPGGRLNRYFAVERSKNGSLHVVADFVAAASPEITRVHWRNGALSFESGQGAVILVKARQ